MWMNFNTFSSSSRVDCAIHINFNLDAVDKGWKLLLLPTTSVRVNFILGKLHVIRVNVLTMRIHSGVNKNLRLREVMDPNIPDICAFACSLLLCTRLSF